MNRMPAIALLLAAGLSRAAAAQDYPPLPPSHPEPEEDEPGLWFRNPNVGYGPFHYVSLSLVPSLRSGFETRFPGSLPAEKFELSVGESWVKNFGSSDEWRMDFDLLRSNIGFSWGISDSVRVDLNIESGQRTGDGLDAFILGFHQSFGLAIGKRDQFSRDENRIEIRPPGGGETIVVDERTAQPYEQAALLTFQHTLTHGDEAWPAVSWSLSVRRELDEGDLRGSSGALGGSVGLAKAVGPCHFYLGGNFAWFGQQEFYGLKLRTTQWSGLFGVEWNLAPPFSLVAQYLITSGGVDRLGALSEASHEVTAGFKWEFLTGVLLDLAVVENIINPDNSPDFGIHAGITFRW